MENVFNEIPADNADILIQNWEKSDEAQLLNDKEKKIWRTAFTWALDQGVGQMLSDGYAEIEFGDPWNVKFTEKLYDKFNISEISSVD